MADLDRRRLLQLFGLGGVVFASSLAGVGARAEAEGGALSLLPAGALRKDGHRDFYFVQLSDTHHGFKGPLVNPNADGMLARAVDAVNALPHPPAFVVFTGDLTHTTDDPAERRARMASFKSIAGKLRVPMVRHLPGEHDAALDAGEAFREAFGPLHYSFDHQGVHFVALDNVSDPKAHLGEAQLEWLDADLARLDRAAPVVALTHRPLFDLMASWDWATPDGARAIDILQKKDNVTVFYGHIHQTHHAQTGRIAHHATRSLMFPLPAPGSVPRKAPILWDPAHPYRGLGFREVDREGSTLELDERDLEAK